MIKVHINNTKHITFANIDIPPGDSTSTHYKTVETDKQHYIQYITNITHSVITGDVNAHYHQTTYPLSPQLTYDMTTDYNKTDGLLPTTRKLTGHNSRKTQVRFRSDHHTQQHTPANIIFTNIILMADIYNIPKGKMHNNCRLLHDHIVCKITQRNNIRRANTCDPALKLLNKKITFDIQKHKQNLWKEHLDAHLDHRHNMHIVWKIIYGLTNRAFYSLQT